MKTKTIQTYNKHFLLLLLVGLLWMPKSVAQEESQTTTPVLTLTVSGIKKTKGFLLIAVFDNAEDYENDGNNGNDDGNNAIQKFKIPVKGKTQTVEIEGLDFGSYGIKMYQDINENGSLDKNFLGMPEEPFGFSNNAQAIFSEPDFEETVFDFDGNTAIKIALDD